MLDDIFYVYRKGSLDDEYSDSYSHMVRRKQTTHLLTLYSVTEYQDDLGIY